MIPARTDVDVGGYDSMAKQFIADFKSDSLFPARSMFVPTAFGDPVDVALGVFVGDKNVDNLVQTLKNNYDALKTLAASK